jgi:CHAT domain-containing protein
LGFVAQKLGAQSVIASLWPVDDVGTQVLMPEFYRLRQSSPEMTKAEALREAQLALLHGTLKPGGDGAGDTRNVHDDQTTRKAFTPDPKAPYAHPYYWAPFILIGNWK